ncbi:uncharacterized protein [Nicotiana sylvestris]|uniref:uncharacterized protein n=1 Tax=Nicotiana sylvestris TaxID=4096 RepID=UPI00388C7E71
MCKEFAEMMGNAFEMSMMDELNFFLGLQIKQMPTGTMIHQQKYIKELLKMFTMYSSKSLDTHIATATKLDIDEVGKSVEKKLYRGMIRSLLYLIASKPDIVFSVGLCARFQGDTVAKEFVVQGESVPVTIDHVQHPPSKLDVLVSAIDVAPLDTLSPMSEKPQMEKFTVEKGAGDMGKEQDAQKIANEEEKSDNEGASGDEKESDTDDKTGKQSNDFSEEENHSKENEDPKSEGEDKKKESESEAGDEEIEEEDRNMSEESECSMTIENTVITPSEETGKETRAQEPGSLLTPFTGNEEVCSNEDDVPLSEAGKRSKKAHESRSTKTPKKKALIVEPDIVVDGEDEFDFALPAKSATPKRKSAKVTKPATSFAWSSRGKTRKNVPAVFDRLTKFKNKKVLNGRILANTDEKGWLN